MEGEGDGAYVIVQGGHFWRVHWIGDLEETERTMETPRGFGNQRWRKGIREARKSNFGITSKLIERAPEKSCVFFLHCISDTYQIVNNEPL